MLNGILRTALGDVPVEVDMVKVVDTRDRRGHYEGHLWSAQVPEAASLEGRLLLLLPDGSEHPVRIVGTSAEFVSNEDVPRGYFEARFLSDRNWKDWGEEEDATRETTG